MATLILAWLAGCSATKVDEPSTQPSPKPPETQSRVIVPLPVPAQRPVDIIKNSSAARNAKDYRKDAASHLYTQHSQHIYKGRLPPMLEAVGVLNVDIDRHGAVKSVNWTRAPKHVPHVMQEIERLVKAAAPYPVPQNLSQVTYTDVWLWHKSGKFQLDTLTEGQD
ncbi:MAG: hypothetical protein CFE38_00795 [Comamonadaceae bacterium PBBC1]|nr:MAG: hypothetical protein CFE38_00795 [Comamonadaceae bacterium PBBC1]